MSEPKKVISESADDLNWAEIDGFVNGILQSFRFAQVKPLASLAVSLKCFETIARNMLDSSAHGRFEQNKEGLIGPLEEVLARLREYKPPKGYIMGPQDLPPSQV